MAALPSIPLLLALLCAAPPPLADAPPGEATPERAASPSTDAELGFFHARRLRFSLGLSWAHLALNAPGGNSLGGGASVAHEWRYAEVALSLFGHGGFGSQDSRARHTGPATSYARASLRVAPFPAWLRVMVEAGAQAGYEPAWSWCVSAGGLDQCGTVPARATFAGVAGVVIVLRASRAHVTLGLDAILRGPNPPPVCGSLIGECRAAAIGEGLLGAQAWLEAGWGGLSW
ncbi:MAG TPA: hypothetical protein VGK67_36365 [Myxococcales bacterium]|jgi:hypothetical protein